MKPILAGLTVWTIEIIITAIMLYMVNHEESKVFERRRRGR